MIKVKESEYLFQQAPKEVANKIYGKTSRKSMIQFTSTSTWVIFPERLMIGKKIENGAIISRYRHTLKALFPKIYATWTVNGDDSQTRMKVVYKLGLVTTVFGFIFLLPLVIGLGRLLISGDFDQFLDDALLSIIILTVGYLLTRNEINQTEKLLLKLVKENQVNEDASTTIT